MSCCVRRRCGFLSHQEKLVQGNSRVEVPLSLNISHQLYALETAGLQGRGSHLTFGSENVLMKCYFAKQVRKTRRAETIIENREFGIFVCTHIIIDNQ